MQDRQKPTPGAGFSLNLGDIYHVLFRHKWKILIVWILGSIVAGALYLKWPVLFSSEALINVRYVEDKREINLSQTDSRNIMSTSPGADSVIKTEMLMLQNLDVAREAAETLGPEMVFKLTGTTNTYVAAAVIRGSIQIENAYRTPVMQVIFRHANPEIVQPVLKQVIESYKNAHKAMHDLMGSGDEKLSMQIDVLKNKLTQTQNELSELKSTNGVDQITETKRMNTERLAKTKEELWTAETELAEHLAIINSFTNGTAAAKTDTNAPTAPSQAPSEKISEYQAICTQLESLQTRKNDLLLIYQEKTPRVQTVQEQIDRNLKLKGELERDFPQLLSYRITPSNPNGQKGVPALDIAKENTFILALQTRIARLQQHLKEIQDHVDKVASVENKIKNLERQRDVDEANLTAFERKLFDEKTEQEMSSKELNNIKIMQQPSPAAADRSQRNKISRNVLLGALAAGLALAFVIEFYFDRSFKRPIEIEAKLGLPLFLSIPEANGHDKLRLTKRNLRLLTNGNGGTDSPDPGSDGPLAEVPAWKADPDMQPFFEAFRDRLITHFEIKEINHKPKLVAITSCTPGSGVSTVASGLAASLSETGEGNVLLVDMNTEKGAAHFFHKGKLNCGLDEILDKNSNRENAQVEKNLFVVSESSAEDKLPRILHKRFTQLIPKLHASDFDYIIFDMPPVSQTSATTRVARFMDMVFMIVEAEKTDRDVVKRASKMLSEAKATNVGVVLNKSHNYVPGRLNQEL
ncbi:MAG: AAA family ATPase [Verrucomicrobiota bacterium]